MTNKYEIRYEYMRRFVASKVAEETQDSTPEDVRKVVYTTIDTHLTNLHDELDPSHEDEYRFAMWSMVAASYGASESFLSIDLEVANIALDVAEELAAIATTYYPRGGNV